MHTRNPADDEAIRRIFNRNPKNYTWEACQLTRALMNDGNSVPMKAALERLAIWHMNGEKDAQTGYETLSGVNVQLTRRCDPPPGFSDLGDFLKRFKQNSYKKTDTDPPREVQITATVTPPGDIPAWVLAHDRLVIVNPPESYAQKVIQSKIRLSQIIDSPWLDGVEIDCIFRSNQCWKDGEIVDTFEAVRPQNNPCLPESSDDNLDIKLTGAEDFQEIEITPQ